MSGFIVLSLELAINFKLFHYILLCSVFLFVLQCVFVHFVERGSFLALDLGGTNFRVLLITLKDSAHVEMKNKIYPISQATMTGPGSQVQYRGNIYHDR